MPPSTNIVKHTTNTIDFRLKIFFFFWQIPDTFGNLHIRETLFDGSLLKTNQQRMRAIWAALKESAKGHRINLVTLTKR